MRKDLRYNGVNNIVSNFSSKYNYTINNIVFTIPLYNPFQSLSTYNGMIKVKDTLITIDYFKGEKYPLVQPTKIYHSKKKKGKWLYSKKIPKTYIVYIVYRVYSTFFMGETKFFYKN